MADSKFEILMLPLLESLKDGEPNNMEEINAELIRFIEFSDRRTEWFDLEKEKALFNEAVNLAINHLSKAGLIENAGQDGLRISSFGKIVLNKRLNAIDINFLRKLTGYRE